jgi:hypothetical protein
MAARQNAQRQQHFAAAYGKGGQAAEYAAFEPDDSSMKYYTCELECGFTLGGEGAFERVAAHEKTCKGPRVRCTGCGADFPKKEVYEHERVCERKAYVCENGCGFSGNFSVVEKHEQACIARPCKYGCGIVADPEYIEPHERTCTGITQRRCQCGQRITKIHCRSCTRIPNVCEKRCGFAGRFNEVVEHEKVCRNVVCDVCNLYGGTESEVKAHRLLCEINPANVFQCEKGCGKIDTWKVIAEHELRCNGIASGQCGAEDTRCPCQKCMIKRGDFFICERRCGFTETFEVVQEHEKTCKFVPPDMLKPRGGAPGGGARQQSQEDFAYVCVHGCGYTGTYAAVEEHEYICPYGDAGKGAGPPMMDLEGDAMFGDRQRNRADAARIASEIMSMQQSEAFNFVDAAGFWNMAAEDWRSQANMFHMSRMVGGPESLSETNGFGGKGDKKGGAMVDGLGKSKGKAKGKGKAK